MTTFFGSRALRISAFAAAFTLMGSAQALAHAKITATVPAKDAAVSAPQTIDLTFNESVNLKLSTIGVKGPDDAKVATGTPSLSGGGKTVVIPLNGKLAPGAYKVEWNVLSVDGHKVKGGYGFTVSPE